MFLVDLSLNVWLSSYYTSVISFKNICRELAESFTFLFLMEEKMIPAMEYLMNIE